MLKKATTTIAKATQRLFDPETVHEIAMEVGLMKRIRQILPYQLMESLLSSLAAGKVDSVAGLLRDFNADHQKSVDYRAYHDRLASKYFAPFMLKMLGTVAKMMTFSVLDWSSSSSLKNFRDIVIQDGTSFALRDGLAEDFPGRFSALSPAAVEVHVTMSLKTDTFIAATITPDSYSERAYLPPPQTLHKCLFLGDRGYDGIPYLSTVEREGGSYIVRIRSIYDPIITSIQSDVPWIRNLSGHRLSWVASRLKKSKKWDLDAEFILAEGVRYPARLILRWNPKTKAWIRLVCNVPRLEMSASNILSAYRLRWQVELLFKEFKSHSSLRKFQTNNKNIATGLIWASLLASFLKRFLSHTCQVMLPGSVVSTQKMAKKGHRFLRRIIAVVGQGQEELFRELQRLVDFVRVNCMRSRSKRDKERGRAFLNVSPVGSEA